MSTTTMASDQTAVALRERIRADFPALTREIGGRPPAYFDGPAGSQVPRQVIEAIAGYLSSHNANSGGAFATSEETDRLLETARQRLADFVGASAADEIVFGANMTTLTFALSRSLSREWSADDEIVVTQLDHQANVAPWRLAAEDAGLTVRVVPFDPESCTLDMAALEAAVGPRTRLLAIGGASNVVGTVNDVEGAVRIARETGALTFVDAVHLAPHRIMDVQRIGCDFLACSAYKFFGPHVGVLWGRMEHLERLRPYKVPPAPEVGPGRWETGTGNHEGIAGTLAAVEWIASLAADADGGWRERITGGMRAIADLEEPAFDRLLVELRRVPGLRMFGPSDPRQRTPTVAFTMEAASPRTIAERLGAEGIFVWDGDFYASSVIDGLGLRASGGVVRVGLVPYTSDAEVDRLIEALLGIAGR